MILGGYTKQNITTQINQNVFSGLEAKARFANWKRI